MRKFPGILVLGSAALLLVSGCEQQAANDAPSAMTESETALTMAAIDELRGEFQRAIAEQDFAALGQMMHPEAIQVMPASAEWLAMNEVKGDAPFAPQYTITITPIETRIINNEWAYDFGNSVSTYVPEEGAEPIRVRDTYLLLLRNTGDGWKLYREVASASPPPGGWTVE